MDIKLCKGKMTIYIVIGPAAIGKSSFVRGVVGGSAHVIEDYFEMPERPLLRERIAQEIKANWFLSYDTPIVVVCKDMPTNLDYFKSIGYTIKVLTMSEV